MSDGPLRQTNLTNESDEYLARREELRQAEVELMRHRERVAERAARRDRRGQQRTGAAQVEQQARRAHLHDLAGVAVHVARRALEVTALDENGVRSEGEQRGPAGSWVHAAPACRWQR